MCGVVGYVGERRVVPLLVDGLRRLEYRGYDSAGLAVLQDGVVDVRRGAGRVDDLVARLDGRPLPPLGTGIGHTRWATHGRPSDENAHPHVDCTGDFVVAHNGIIENHAALRRELQDEGHAFTSQTDTEVVPHLLEACYTGDLGEAVRQALRRLRGAFALLIATRREPGRVIAVRKESPLVVGLGEDEQFVASDVPAILPYTRAVYVLEDGEMADIRRGEVRVTDWDGRPLAKEVLEVTWDAEMAEKGGYEHFMHKEIHDQPQALKDTLAGRVGAGPAAVELEEVSLSPAAARALRQVYFVACGTAYHAGLVGAHLTERLARVPARADLASEFRYRRPLLDEQTLVVCLSQSGETADTLAALREARARGARLLSIVNVVGSSLAREAGDVIYTRAGPEIAVASTKAYVTQLVASTLLALKLAELRGEAAPAELTAALSRLPDQAAQTLAAEETVARLARDVAAHEHAFFIGRGLDYAAAVEGQLKLKEISYIHAEAYAAGELKHGTLALIEDGVPVVALLTQPGLREKMLSNVEEVRARGGYVIAVAREDDDEARAGADEVLTVPAAPDSLMPVLAAIPLQLLAYHAGRARGCDIDKPRNLAKSVTVE